MIKLSGVNVFLGTLCLAQVESSLSVSTRHDNDAKTALSVKPVFQQVCSVNYSIIKSDVKPCRQIKMNCIKYDECIKAQCLTLTLWV